MHLRSDKMTGQERRKERTRKKVHGTPERPRLNVFRSNKHIYAQVIDDTSAKTLAAASTKTEAAETSALKKTEAAKKVGAEVARLALAKGISKVVFDRSGCKYHGRIKALAEAAREAGLKF